MNPSCKLPCYMNSPGSKMLQIPLKQQLPALKCVNPNFANSLEKWKRPTPKCFKDSWNGSFFSKMLQIARTPGRKNGKKNKKEKQNNSRPPSIGRISSLVGSLKTPLWKQTGTNTPQEWKVEVWYFQLCGRSFFSKASPALTKFGQRWGSCFSHQSSKIMLERWGT